MAPPAAAVVLVRAHDYRHPHKAYSAARRFIGQPDYIIGKTEQRITAALNHGSVGRQFCVPLSPKRMVRYLHPFVWQIGDPYCCTLPSFFFHVLLPAFPKCLLVYWLFSFPFSRFFHFSLFSFILSCRRASFPVYLQCLPVFIYLFIYF